MGVRSWRHVLFSLCLLFSLGLGKAIRLREEENQEISYEFGTKLDAVPVVNPTTPGTANPYPTLNPTTPQAPGTIGQTPSTPTTPYMTPINPYTNPTTPKTSPTTNPTTNPTLSPPSPATTTTPTTPTASAGGQWCVASQSAAESTLKVALDYACGYGADCSSIQPGASCYNPNTLKDHASYAFNDYYQKNPAPTSCAFGGTATLTNKDPSNGNCRYTSSKTPSMSPPTPIYVSPPTPPSTMSPTTPSTMTPTAPTTMIPTTPGIMTPTAPGMTTIPGGASVYGTGPTGSPNIATPVSHSELLLFTLFGLWASLHVEIYM
ncbi:hypothetical protein VNO80_19920 [Phaseolus coccineus]|uniref:X8 domain-containing protein n=1 Tax=Phaseolus coccineus TaxID=3886 RepID=A0AAN9R0Q8_PHACN